MPRPAVFFDRDGTLMHEVHYCDDPAKVVAIPGAAEALDQLAQRGFLNIIITNQSGIGRGYFTVEQFDAVQTALLTQLGESRIAATFFCPDAPGPAAARRKPSPAMIYEAAAAHDVDLSRSFFVGDSASDIGCGKAAGVRTVLVETGYGKRDAACQPDFHAATVVDAVAIILDVSP